MLKNTLQKKNATIFRSQELYSKIIAKCLIRKLSFATKCIITSKGVCKINCLECLECFEVPRGALCPKCPLSAEVPKNLSDRVPQVLECSSARVSFECLISIRVLFELKRSATLLEMNSLIVL